LSNVTDEGEQLYFIGTLQYSPPELLFREENPSIEGWRGVTFYQLGAVLHDLLMRKPLFMESTNPYARLVRAVEREIPRLDSAAADSDLRLLAQNCLSKVPSQRLDTVSWESFNQPPTADPLEMARRTIAQRRAAAASIPAISPNTEELREQQCFALRTSLDSAVVNTITSETMPRYSTRDSGTANPYLVKVLFQPSPSDGLMHYFACYFEGAIADPLTALRELKVWACIAANETLIPEHPEAARIGAALRGALIDQDVRAMVHDCLLMAYAQALDSSAAPGEIVWLPIRGTL
jgi:serine/threonine protein kinase